MARYSPHLILKEFARPPPSGINEFYRPAVDVAHQLPSEVLRGKLEVMVLTRKPSVAFHEVWRWTRDENGDRQETLSLTCMPADGFDHQDFAILSRLEDEYVRDRLERVASNFKATLPRRRHGIRPYDSDGNFGDWRRQDGEGVIRFRLAHPLKYRVSFARIADEALRCHLFPYLPGDQLRVEYRPLAPRTYRRVSD